MSGVGWTCFQSAREIAILGAVERGAFDPQGCRGDRESGRGKSTTKAQAAIHSLVGGGHLSGKEDATPFRTGATP